jgi:uncharacterized SAM-binding protein YcdF (DUF218 family)
MFYLSKLMWALIAPGHFLVALLAIGALMGLGRGRVRRIGTRLCAFVAVIFLFVALFPVGDWALTPLENRYTAQYPDHVDGIITIGEDEKIQISEARGIPTSLGVLRSYVAFAGLARQYPDARLVFSGGEAFHINGVTFGPARIVHDIMQELGVPVERMIFEDKSRTTYENALLTAGIVQPKPEENWLLVTSAWHMVRAMGCFRQTGWHVYPVPAGYMTTGRYSWRPHLNLAEHLDTLTIAVHEYYGLLAYWLMGRIPELWPV